jgi:hypothetical protein
MTALDDDTRPRRALIASPEALADRELPLRIGRVAGLDRVVPFGVELVAWSWTAASSASVTLILLG